MQNVIKFNRNEYVRHGITIRILFHLCTIWFSIGIKIEKNKIIFHEECPYNFFRYLLLYTETMNEVCCLKEC